jgi:hypothetical protein
MSDSECIGINIETLRCHMATAHDFTNIAKTANSIPPAMVLPSGRHQLQLDQCFPAYPAGTGQTWPEAAQVEGGFSRRMPVGLLWQLANDQRIWTVDAETSIDPIQALGIAARQLMGQTSGSVGLVIPNWLRQSQQQVLLDAASRSGAKWYLVWRPIAAATEWLSRFPLNPPVTNTRQLIGKLVVLHLGLFECEFTVVEIVVEPVNGSLILLPARLRADKESDFRPGTMSSDFLNTIAKEQNVDVESQEVWQQMWTTPWLIRELNALSGKVELPSGVYSDRNDPPARVLHLATSNSGMGGNAGVKWRVEPIGAIRTWVEQKLRDAGPVVGAVVTGELAAVSAGGKILGVSFLEKSVSSSHILVSGSNSEIDVLAAGAAKQCSRLVSSQPSYLTKLPLLRTVVSRMGLPEWISLLSDDDAYVSGGQKWSRPQPVGGIRIPGSKVLKLAVDHEDFDGVREASVSIPASYLPNQAAELHVEITPAQGNARIELVTIPRRKEQNPIVANLQKMEAVLNANQQSVSPKNYLDLYPRLAPPLLERLSSPTAWTTIARSHVVPLIRSKLPQKWTTAEMSQIKEALLKKRKPGSGLNVTAIGSDGVVSTNRAELDQLVEGAFSLLKSRDSNLAENAKRLIAYTSTALPLIQVYLVKNSQVSPQRDEDFRMIGNCLRDPKGISNFLLACESMRLTTHHIRTIAELVCYRETALELVPTEKLNLIYRAIAEEFSAHSRYPSLELHFRYLTLCVAFLLRRRIFDDSFIPPDSELAALVKQTCLAVIHGYENGTIHVMGGAVDLPAVMRQLIKYVDREGQGAFVLAT